MKALDLLDFSKGFHIKKEDSFYKVSHEDDDLVAYIGGKEVEYYISGCYNSGINLKQIDVEAFRRLVKFCEAIIKLEEDKYEQKT